ncbi:MAG: S-layer homology domain-containing protein, partial [Oscillospiraceae bacterium]|nr:S-layer homology domain-containing protein [Oscillospiraceae bacterium]
MLLPCLPTSSSAAGEPIELWQWVAVNSSSAREEHTELFNSNVLNETTSPTWSHYTASGTVYDENGPFSLKSFSFQNTASFQSGTGLHYGLPYATINGYRKTAETLRFELGFLKKNNVDTTGLEAVNLEFTYVDWNKKNNNVVAYCREMMVFVSTDGETFLPGHVGIRATKLLAGGNVRSGDEGIVYQLQTENLFNIDGLKPGDVIQNIRILPEGETARPAGWMTFHDITINGYKTMEDFENCVPKPETVTIDPAILRQIVVEEAVRTATIPWTTDTIIDLSSPQGSSAVATTFATRQYIPGIQYQGPVYARTMDATREQLEAVIKDGKYVGGFATDNALGMDCQTFGFNATSRVSQNYGWACEFLPGAPGTKLLGSDFLVLSETTPRFTDAHIVDLNTPQAVYESYALADTGDIMDSYRSNSSNSLHVRIVKDVVTVRNPDGTIDPNASYMYCAESSATMRYKIQKADGSIVILTTSDPTEDIPPFLADNPGAKVVLGYTGRDHEKYTFNSLRNEKYVMFTLDEYEDGVVELPRVEAIFSPMTTGSTIAESGLHLTVASNYRIIGYTIKLEDLSTGNVLFEDFRTPTADPICVNFNYENTNLNATMANLPNGNYRLSATVDSGPLTELGQSKVPTSTKSVEFTVTDKQDAKDSATLALPSSATAGETVKVLVRSNSAFDAADVTVKYDPDLLSWVEGTFTPVNGMGDIAQENGAVRIMTVDSAITSAGQIATLTFKAKRDIADFTNAASIKSAVLVTAENAAAGNAEKAISATESCASLHYADVIRGAWYHDAADYALSNGIMAGYGNDTFAPNDNLSRAMVVQVLYNKEGQPVIEGAHKFPDVKRGDWFNNAITWANQNQILGGYGDGTFQPNKNVSLEEVAVILWNYAGSPDPTGETAFTGAHSDWAANALNWAVSEGILKDMPYEAVTATASRAQTAQMLMNFLSK